MKKAIPYLIITVLAVLVIYLLNEKKQQTERYISNFKAQHAQLEYLLLENGQLVAQKAALEVTNKEITNQLWVKDDSLKVLTDLYRKVKGTVTVKTVYIHDTLYIETEPKDQAGLRNFFKSSPHLVIGGVIGDDFLEIDTLSMPNTIRVVYGVEKGFFRRKLSATVSHSNPMISTTDMTAQIAQERIKRFSIGPFGGIDITGNPTFGVGISYGLIRF